MRWKLQDAPRMSRRRGAAAGPESALEMARQLLPGPCAPAPAGAFQGQPRLLRHLGGAVPAHLRLPMRFPRTVEGRVVEGILLLGRGFSIADSLHRNSGGAA